jgi:hypothetical protein
MKTVWTNIAPRVGVSWDPKADGRTSIRAGYGMTGDFVTGQFFFDSRSAPPFGLEQRLTNAILDDPWGSVNRANPYPVEVGGQNYPWSAALYPLFITVPYDIKTTRNHSWNVGIQQQVGENMAFSATYLGNHMVNVWGVVDANPGVVTTAGATPTSPCVVRGQTFANCNATLDQRRELSLFNPALGQFFGYLDYVSDAGWQDYQGLLLSVQRRTVGGITATANYTLSRCEGLISQGQSPLNVATGYTRPISLLSPPSEAEQEAIFELDRGNCDAWRKHIFNATATVESPQFTNTAARMLGSGWRLAGIYRATSGRPLTVTTGVDRALSGMQATNQRANQVLDDPYGNKTLSNWLNPAAFAQPALGTYGNSGRNAYFGMGAHQVDLALSRSFRMANNHRIEARVEAFNAFNWFRPSSLDLAQAPVTNLSSASFGRYLAADDPRVMQFALKYEF